MFSNDQPICGTFDAGKVLGSWQVTSPSEGPYSITGTAVTASGRVFVSGQPKHKSSDPPAEWKLLLYELDKSSGALREIDYPQAGPTRVTLLLGSEDDNLVFYGKWPAFLSWFAIQ